LLVFALAAGALGLDARPAYAYNCVNVVLRDPYWSQFRGIAQSISAAAGMGAAFARRGFAVNNAPSAGAIMVWPPGYAGASGSGHVGVVAGINGNGTVVVRHENWPYGRPERAQVVAVGPRHQFVHRADSVRSGPAAPPAVAPPPVEVPDAGAEIEPDAESGAEDSA
jgi:surface antigen